MTWIKVTDPRLEVPRDESVFLAIWINKSFYNIVNFSSTYTY